MKFEYKLSGNCGTTTLEGSIDSGRFDMKYRSRWMGGHENEWSMEGMVEKQTETHLVLYAESISGNKVSDTAYELYLLGSDHSFPYGTNEDEGMVMGGCSVNRECKYDALLILLKNGDKLEAWNPGEKVLRCYTEEVAQE